MKKIFLLMLTLCTSIGVWADEVSTMPSEVYLIGDAIEETGWTLPGSAMTQVPGTNVWTWTGKLNANSFRVCINKNAQYGTDTDFWGRATNDDATIYSGIKHTLQSSSSENFNITSDGAGDNKTIIVDFDKEIVLLGTTYQIYSEDDYKFFAEEVNKGACTSYNVDLKNNIESLSTDKAIGNWDHPYTGTFDGNNHKVNITLGNGGDANIGLLGVVNGATVKNVIVAGSVKGTNNVAGIVGYTQDGGVTLSNCGNEATINGSESNASGLVGFSTGDINITNCYNKADVTGRDGTAAFCGWYGSKTATITNCYNAGTITGVDDESRGLYRGNGTATIANCYNTENNRQGTVVTSDQVVNGYLCYNLNGSFTQDLSSSNSYPTFGQEKVAQMTKISDAQYATWVATANVDKLPYGVTAYSAELRDNNSWVKLNPTETIKKGDAVVLYKENATDMQYTNITEEEVEGAQNNALTSSTEDVTVGDDQHYVLAQVEGVVGFHRVNQNTTIKAGKGFIYLSNPGAREFLGFDGEATGINAVNSEQLTGNKYEMFNLAGQRVAGSAKGIVINNGKKVIK